MKAGPRTLQLVEALSCDVNSRRVDVRRSCRSQRTTSTSRAGNPAARRCSAGMPAAAPATRAAAAAAAARMRRWEWWRWCQQQPARPAGSAAPPRAPTGPASTSVRRPARHAPSPAPGAASTRYLLTYQALQSLRQLLETIDSCRQANKPMTCCSWLHYIALGCAAAVLTIFFNSRALPGEVLMQFRCNCRFSWSIVCWTAGQLQHAMRGAGRPTALRRAVRNAAGMRPPLPRRLRRALPARQVLRRSCLRQHAPGRFSDMDQSLQS